jgi:tetratricopeptide (TPR) repeat protein
MMIAFLIAATLAARGATHHGLPTWSDIVQRIDHGNAASDPAMLRAAAADAERLADITGDGRERQLALLGAAFANSRLAFLPGVDDSETSAALKRAEHLLQTAVTADNKYAEAYALLGAVRGSLIRAGGSAMELGPAAHEALDRALSLAPDNPRVLLQAGINTMHTPPEYGGGTDKAEGLLRRSLAAFDREPPGRPWPNWGRFDAHVWLGQVLLARADKAGARQEYEAALKIVPDSGWVKYKLLPVLERK